MKKHLTTPQLCSFKTSVMIYLQRLLKTFFAQQQAGILLHKNNFEFSQYEEMTQMQIGSVIRKYRKESGLTQEEMEKRLGVTTPAVNKWENGNTNPDIELLAPIARLLHISLDTLLSFQEKLTDTEIETLIRQMGDKLEKEGFEKTYEWAVQITKKYPNCNMLIWQIAVMLDAGRIIGACGNPEQYDEQINAWYEMVLQDENEEIQYHAADSLFGFYLRKKEYVAAEKYLNYFSEHDPMKKIYRTRLYKEQGKTEEAYKTIEEVLLSQNQTLGVTFSFLLSMALKEKDFDYGRVLAEKMGAIAHTFEMGKYSECSAMLDVVCAEKNVEGTFQVVRQLFENVESIGDFSGSKLYRHLQFKKNARWNADELREKLLEGFRNETEFSYMKGYEPWEKLVSKQEK